MRLISVIARRFSNLDPNERQRQRDVLDAYRDCLELTALSGMEVRKQGVEH